MADNAADEQLIEQYQNGDAAAFEVLYGRYKNALYHYFFRQVNSAGTADELHQDVWLNIVRSPSSFKQQASFKTWLYKIAHNRLVDYYRQHSKQPLYLVHNDDETLSDSSNEQSAASADEPDINLQTEQASHALLQCISALPDVQREVFILHESSGLTLQTIAGIMDSTVESTKSRLRYAVKKLRHNMAQYMAVKR